MILAVNFAKTFLLLYSDGITSDTMLVTIKTLFLMLFRDSDTCRHFQNSEDDKSGRKCDGLSNRDTSVMAGYKRG